MAVSISNALSIASLAATEAASNNADTQPQPVYNVADTVQLSDAQQAVQLYRQGQTVTQISTRLSLPVELVNNYLGLKPG